MQNLAIFPSPLQERVWSLGEQTGMNWVRRSLIALHKGGRRFLDEEGEHKELLEAGGGCKKVDLLERS